MNMKFVNFILFLFIHNNLGLVNAIIFPPSDGEYAQFYPKLCLGIDVLQTEYVLAYFMGLIEDLRYPKDQIHLNFYANQNNSSIIRWTRDFPVGLYKSIDLIGNDENWREHALSFARRKSCHYLLLLDSDAFLLRDSVRNLISICQNRVVTSPLLHSPSAEYTNAQALGLDEDFIQRKRLEFIRVYYSKGPLLINLKHMDSSYLTFAPDNLPNYTGTGDPIDVFAYSAFALDIHIVFSNHFQYGYFIDSTTHVGHEHAAIFSAFLANWVSSIGPMPFPTSVALQPWYPVPTKFGFDEVYLINLARRPERLEKMQEVFRLIGLQFQRVDAVDGKALSPKQLEALKFMPGYLDPFHQRPMKTGEIGCFLSHLKVWEDIVRKGNQRSIVLEDDVRFTENGTIIIHKMMEDLMKTRFEWDFIYLGRKRMGSSSEEFFVPGHRYLSTVGYSYWTLGYAITLEGARKLLAARPLDHLLALDEFLPIMYGQHPNLNWSAHFEPRDLRAFALYPVAVEPERYTHQPGYVSDTESTEIIDNVMGAENIPLGEKMPMETNFAVKDEF